MIEMLGVLAIIGVLSVGGIAGYSKAMMKFKINKTVDQISTIVANTRTLYSSQKKYEGLNATIARKAHLIPDEMITGTGNDWGQFENAFGGSVEMDWAGKTPAGGSGHIGDKKAFTLRFHGIPEEACMELATMDWGSNSSSGLISVNVGNTAGMDFINCEGSAESNRAVACPNGSNVAIPMPVSIAAQACSGDNNLISFKYY